MCQIHSRNRVIYYSVKCHIARWRLRCTWQLFIYFSRFEYCTTMLWYLRTHKTQNESAINWHFVVCVSNEFLRRFFFRSDTNREPSSPCIVYRCFFEVCIFHWWNKFMPAQILQYFFFIIVFQNISHSMRIGEQMNFMRCNIINDWYIIWLLALLSLLVYCIHICG